VQELANYRTEIKTYEGGNPMILTDPHEIDAFEAHYGIQNN